MMLNCGGRTKEVLVEVLKGSTEQEEVSEPSQAQLDR